MHAVVIDKGELRWEEQPDPVAGDTEVAVAVRAAGLNGADMFQRRGLYPSPPGSPANIPGLEMAGEVVSVGRSVTRFALGDRVMAIVGGGGQAEISVVDESHALAVPDRTSWTEAGGFPETFSTAYDALFTQCGLGSGERLLVTGAAGGVGTAAIQLGRLA
ncbi:MAG TPA: alcohol dehydrogenase catalytic domain-containing protein, partial [Acidimicrobiales bacterium]|nr:alcohol dehydrogenase catalytic domain-containing protein [Acidimicrobiales bacterium]